MQKYKKKHLPLSHRFAHSTAAVVSAVTGHGFKPQIGSMMQQRNHAESVFLISNLNILNNRACGGRELAGCENPFPPSADQRVSIYARAL